MKSILYYTFILVIVLFSGCSSGKNHADNDIHEDVHDQRGTEDNHLHEKDSEHNEHQDDHSSLSDGNKHSTNEIHDESDGHSDHTLLEIRKKPFAFTIRTGGRILVDSRDVQIITAKSSGLVKLRDDYLFPGVEVSKGQTLFFVTGEQLAGDNTELYLSQVKYDLEEASVNFERAKKLIADRIITEEHYLSVKSKYEKLLNEYENLNATTGRNGNIVSAAGNGYIREVFVTEGQKVSPGQPLASIVIEHNLVLRADVSPENLDVLSSVESANFTVGYSDKLYSTSKMNGRKISQGKSTGENSFYIPVFFRMDYDPALIEGTFAEVFLIGKEIAEAIVVPNTALMEEYGKLYVFVEDDEGEFSKRYIEAGHDNGEETLVNSGLSENDKIVATGSYSIKLSQMVNTAPAHAHSH